MSIFHLNSYREVIEQKIREHCLQKGYKGHLSQKMGIQTSHFSQVLAGKIDLSPDQAAKLCDEWMFDDSEANYFINLIYLERATSVSLKRRIRKTLDTLRMAIGLGNDVVVLSERKTDIDYLPFYTSWVYPAVYAALKIKDINTETRVAKRLNFSHEIALSTLEGLAKMKLITSQDGKWATTREGIVNSSRNTQAISQSELRSKAHQLFVEGDTEMIRFSSLSVVTTMQFIELRERIQKVVAEYHNDSWEILPDPQEIVVFNVDFFRIGKSEIVDSK